VNRTRIPEDCVVFVCILEYFVVVVLVSFFLSSVFGDLDPVARKVYKILLRTN
jgi:hypothetical protein